MSKSKKQALSIKKFQIAKIPNLQCIRGGDYDPNPEKTSPALGILGVLDMDAELQDN